MFDLVLGASTLLILGLTFYAGFKIGQRSLRKTYRLVKIEPIPGDFAENFKKIMDEFHRSE